MNDLGYVPEPPKKSDSGATPVTIVSDEDAEKKPQYPSLRLNGEQASKAGFEDCKYGEEYELTIRIKTTSIGGYQWDRKDPDKPAIEFDVIASDEPKMVEGSKEDEPEEKKTGRKAKQREVGPDDDWNNEYKGID